MTALVRHNAELILPIQLIPVNKIQEYEVLPRKIGRGLHQVLSYPMPE